MTDLDFEARSLGLCLEYICFLNEEFLSVKTVIGSCCKETVRQETEGLLCESPSGHRWGAALFIVHCPQKNLHGCQSAPPQGMKEDQAGEILVSIWKMEPGTHALPIKQHAFHGPLYVLRLLKSDPESFSFGKGL